MDLDDIKAQFDRIFASRPTGDSRGEAALLREALIEFKVGIQQLREAMDRTAGQVVSLQREIADAERRGQLAAAIDDADTVAVAEEFTTRVREKLAILERKAAAQRDELLVAEHEYEVTRQRFQSARLGTSTTGRVESPLEDPLDPLADVRFDQQVRDAAVEAQLAHLKKKLADRG